jgi:hypothetical protein
MNKAMSIMSMHIRTYVLHSLTKGNIDSESSCRLRHVWKQILSPWFLANKSNLILLKQLSLASFAYSKLAFWEQTLCQLALQTFPCCLPFFWQTSAARQSRWHIQRHASQIWNGNDLSSGRRINSIAFMIQSILPDFPVPFVMSHQKSLLEPCRRRLLLWPWRFPKTSKQLSNF